MGQNSLKEIRKHLENASEELDEAAKVAERVGDRRGLKKIRESKEHVERTAKDGFGKDSL